MLSTASLLGRVEFFRLDANRKLDDKRRSDLGQFMTPAPITRLMASMFTTTAPEIRLLDPGAGVGSLLSAAVEQFCQRPVRPRRMYVTAYELDPTLLPYLHDTLKLCQQYCASHGVAFDSEILPTDFITHAVDQLALPLFRDDHPAYTCTILNPPYRKIQIDSAPRQQLRRVGLETSNLYTGYLDC